jgi:hypothetical protein
MAGGTRASSFHTKTQTHDENVVKMERLPLSATGDTQNERAATT